MVPTYAPIYLKLQKPCEAYRRMHHEMYRRTHSLLQKRRNHVENVPTYLVFTDRFGNAELVQNASYTHMYPSFETAELCATCTDDASTKRTGGCTAHLKNTEIVRTMYRYMHQLLWKCRTHAKMYHTCICIDLFEICAKSTDERIDEIPIYRRMHRLLKKRRSRARCTGSSESPKLVRNEPTNTPM